MLDNTELLTRAERKALKRKRRLADKARNARRATVRNLGRGVVAVVVIIAIGAGIRSYSANRSVLPPKTQAGHSEASPASHILDEPMGERTHRHMLEHSDGSGPPGVIVNYNCEDFECEDNFVERLAEIVRKYPANVYLAPYPRMTERLVITREGLQQVLEDIDEKRIVRFIQQR